MANKAKSSQPAVKKPRNIPFKLLILAGMAVMFYMGYKLFQETYKQNQINMEIAALQEEIGTLNQDNENLSQLINYLQTEEFKEKEAREKLNLIKEGEHLVLVKEKEVMTTAQPELEKKTAEVVIKRANYYWWWHYYFSL